MTVAELTLTGPMAATASDSDAALVERLRAGERMALNEAYQAHHAVVRGFARRLIGEDAAAEDVVHDTFLALPKAVANFRGESTLRSFVIGVAANRARRHVRAAARRRRAMERLADTRVGRTESAAGPDYESQRHRLADRLTAALAELAHDHRVAFVLCEVEQRTAVEVAVILGAPEGTIRSRVFHAKRRLRELLAAEVDHG